MTEALTRKGPPWPERFRRSRPICAHCGKPVERFSESFDEFMGRTRFVAECHGKRETVDVHNDEHGGLEFGSAFVSAKALPPG